MKRILLFGLLSLLALAGIRWITLPGPVHASGTVGDGIPASCTEDRLDDVLATGGYVTFDCGRSPVEIVITSPKVISTNTNLIGDNLITLRGVADPALDTQLFHVEPGGRLELTNMTLSGGRATPGGAFDESYGGAIYNQGHVIAIGVTFQDNRAEGGGAIFNNGGEVEIRNSTFTNNQSSRVAGGALHNDSGGTMTVEDSQFTLNAAPRGAAIYHDGPLTVSGTNFTFNVAEDAGGAIYSQYHDLRIISSDFNNNVAQYGGALAITGVAVGTSVDTPRTARIEDSGFKQNTATRGGGIYIDGVIDVTISRSRFEANQTSKLPEDFNAAIPSHTDPFSGRGDLGGGAIYSKSALLTVLDSTLTENRSRIHGGGILNMFGTLTVQRSTLSNNRTGEIGGGIFHAYDADNELRIINSTLSANEAGTGGAIGQADESQNNIIIRYSTIAYNEANRLAGISGFVDQIESSILAYNGPGDTCQNPPRSASGVSFQFPDSSCGGDLLVVDPELMPLSDWGGLTYTHPLRASSPALDVVSSCTLANDQRVFSRPGGPACDSGAFELDGEELASPPPEPIIQEETPTPSNDNGDEPQIILECGDFRIAAPRDGLANGQQPFYWDPAPDATGYQLLIYDAEQGALLASYDIPAPASSATLDVSSHTIGGGFFLRYELHALYNGQILCTDTVSLQREPPTPLQGQPDQPAQPVCGNGVCEQGEHNNCQVDCSSEE